MQRITLEELKHILYHAFQDHLTMKDIENIIINEEESLNENSGNCQTEFEGRGTFNKYACYFNRELQNVHNGDQQCIIRADLKEHVPRGIRTIFIFTCS